MSKVVTKELQQTIALVKTRNEKRKELCLLEAEVNNLGTSEEIALIERFAELLAENPSEKKLDGLRYNGSVSISPLEATLTPKKFFRNDNPEVKLYIYSSFENCVLASARTISKRPGIKIGSYHPTKPMSDTEIRTQFGDRHIFELDDFFHALVGLLKGQPKGESGVLLNDGSVNLFHVRIGPLVLVACVRWRSSKWHVLGWDLVGDGRWCAGTRVFSRNG